MNINIKETLIFRKLKEMDIETLRRWRMEASTTKFLLSDPVITSEQQRIWYCTIKDSRDCLYWIINFNERDIGYANLERIDEQNKTADPGMFICDPQSKGRGLSKSIMINVQEYAFERMGLNKLYGPVIEGNYAALSSYMKSGWKIEGTLRQHIFKYGRFRDLYMIALLKEDWIKIRDSLKAERFLRAEWFD